ncbi:MAG TPA: transcription antitermination factor NusB [Lentimicrobium sp.]|nr:transcription antitermination factor NusB [Lentimicrobium sp.]
MLSRRHLRIKVMQSLYAYFQTEDTPILNSEKKLVANIESIYDLYIYLLSSLLEIADVARNLMEEARQKYLPTAEEVNPNPRFIDNKFLTQLENNRDLRKNINRLKINWSDDKELFRRIFLNFRDTDGYKNYMNAPAASYKDDKEIVVVLLTENMLASDPFVSLFEEKNIYWADDMDTAVMMVLKTLKKWNKSIDEHELLPPLLVSPDEEGDDLITDFVLKLFRKTIINSGEYAKLIAKYADNWEFERIAVLDTILFKMALSEFIEFPSIPVKVTINEYIEISKEYSTPKSRQFINGLLDKMAVDLKMEGKLKKMGRGLIE